MEPVVTTLAVGAAKGASSVLGKQAAALLTKKTVRRRVARATVNRARQAGIDVRARELRVWLSDPVVRRRMQLATVEAHAENAASVEALPSYRESISPPAESLMQIVDDEVLRVLSPGDSAVEATRRNERALETTARQLLTSRGDADAFQDAVVRLHPWRQAGAKALGEQWPAFRELVILLANSGDHRVLLVQWSTNPPVQLQNAPAAAFSWLALVAGDYGVPEGAIQWTETAVECGASASYAWARAGFMVPDEDGSTSASRAVYERSRPPHALAAAALAIYDEKYEQAEAILSSWTSEDPNDSAIAAIVRMGAATGLKQYDRAIILGLDAVAQFPDSSGALLRTAEQLLARGHRRITTHPLSDFARAYELAIRARDSRRRWSGDSAAAVLVAVRAAAMATDVDLRGRSAETEGMCLT